LIGSGKLAEAGIIVGSIDPEIGRAGSVHDGMIEHSHAGAVGGDIFAASRAEESDVGGNFRGAEQSDE
jgi:hypothetical protein